VSPRTLLGPLACVVLLLTALQPPAQAGDTEPLPERTITSQVTDVKNRLVLRGDVDPGHEERIVVIQKRGCKSCSWFVFRKVRADDEGRFRVRIDAPRKGSWFWRAAVREYGGYAASYSTTWRTWNA
jgi:hypothetical protein